MRLSDTLQQFAREELIEYDSDPRYLFIFCDLNTLEGLASGYLKVFTFERAVNDTNEWIRYNRKLLRDEGKVFVAIYQRSDLEDAGFIEPIIIEKPKDRYEWYEKIDDGFEEIRINHSTNIVIPVGYVALLSPLEKISKNRKQFENSFVL